MSDWPIPTCPECQGEFCLALTYSDIYGIAIQCQNCNDEFPMDDVRKLFKQPQKARKGPLTERP